MAFTWDCCIKFTYKAADLQLSKLTQYCKKLPAGTGQAANVIPIHTKKTRRDPGHCRPESLSSILSKGSRGYKNKVIAGRDKRGLLDKMLHGFCKEKPCLTNPAESLVCISKDRERRYSRHSTIQFWKRFWLGSTPKVIKEINLPQDGRRKSYK